MRPYLATRRRNLCQIAGRRSGNKAGAYFWLWLLLLTRDAGFSRVCYHGGLNIYLFVCSLLVSVQPALRRLRVVAPEQWQVSEVKRSRDDAFLREPVHQGGFCLCFHILY